MINVLIYGNLGPKVFNQYQDGVRTSIFSYLTRTPIITQNTILSQEPFSPDFQQISPFEYIISIHDFQQLYQQYSDSTFIFTTVKYFTELDCITSYQSAYLINFN
jgi:hypothetical protein